MMRLRDGWRAGRDLRLLGKPMRAAERIYWAHIIRRARLVDLEYVAAQLGHHVSARAAVRHYVRNGFRSGFRLNPLFVDVTVGDHLPDTGRVPALYAYLVNDPAGLQVSPLWDAAAYVRNHPERGREPGGAVGAAWRRRETESLPTGADASPATTDWLTLRGVILDAANAARTRTPATIEVSYDADLRPFAELVAVFGPDERDYDESVEEIDAFLATGRRAAIGVTDELVESWVQVALLAATRPGVRAVYRPRADPAAVTQELVEKSKASTVVCRGPNISMLGSAAAELAARVRIGALIAPLWVDHDGTIAAVGATSDGRLLAGHPIEDAAAISDSTTVVVPRLAGTVFAAPIGAIAARLRGPDSAAWASGEVIAPRVVNEVHLDLIARSRVQAPGPSLPPIRGGADALMSKAGWTSRSEGPHPRWRRRTRSVALSDGTSVPILRWAIRTAAPAGPRGEWWGDTHFARGIADALRRLGQEVAVDAYPARSRPTTHLDDVTLVLRGPERIDPPGTGTTVAWIISHPDQVTANELDAFNLVFAASSPWSEHATRIFGREVQPLLQCTDAQRFRPVGLTRGDDIVFVGTARGIRRPSVVDPVLAGIPVRVHGPDWRAWIPSHAIVDLGVPNADLSQLYETAGVVLNDHWPAMRRLGFMANRPYDVVAAGGRVISDEVAGLADYFEGAVVVYRDVEELVDMLRQPLDSLFPAEGELRRIAEKIRVNDSFDARARTLLSAVVQTRAT